MNASEIDVSGSTRDVTVWVWNNLVPKSGQASSVQGEMLRAVDKLSREAQNNGNKNWNDRFEMFVSFLESTISSEVRLPEDVRNGAAKDLKRLRDSGTPYLEDDLYERLIDVVAQFCRLNPKPLDRAVDPKQYL